MKKMWIGLALGVVAGCLIADIPEVKQLMEKGKKKISKASKD